METLVGVRAQVSWGKVGAKKRSDSLRTDKLQGEKRGREQGREEEEARGREREVGSSQRKEVSLSLALFLSVRLAGCCFFFLLSSWVFWLPATGWRSFSLFFACLSDLNMDSG